LKKETRKKAEGAFTIGVFLIVIARFFLATASFGDRGVNPWIFALLDIVSAWPYAHYTARLVFALALSEYSRIAYNGVMWVFWFLLPYLYLFAAARDVPSTIWLGLALWMSIFGGAAVFGIIRKSRLQRDASDSEVQ
jgi:hypothetical protein